jgi:hypothetical protein
MTKAWEIFLWSWSKVYEQLKITSPKSITIISNLEFMLKLNKASGVNSQPITTNSLPGFETHQYSNPITITAASVKSKFYNLTARGVVVTKADLW